MKIIYKQPEQQTPSAALAAMNIEKCCFKRLEMKKDFKVTTKKPHHHTVFEVHIITSGEQTYAFENGTHTLKTGDFLIIYPGALHSVLTADRDTEKYSVTFGLEGDFEEKYFIGKTTARMLGNINFAVEETALKREISPVLVENSILELIVEVLRQTDFKEKTLRTDAEENFALALAKQYIKDNIELAPSVSEVARHCGLSEKQTTRIFGCLEGASPGEYIKAKRTKRIEELLCESSLSLKEISEKMSFASEYYFNAFFKKNAGMPPGEYRKMYKI